MIRWLAVSFVALAVGCADGHDDPLGCPNTVVQIPDHVFRARSGDAVRVVDGILTITSTSGETQRFSLENVRGPAAQPRLCGARPAGRGLRTFEVLPDSSPNAGTVRISAVAGHRFAGQATRVEYPNRVGEYPATVTFDDAGRFIDVVFDLPESNRVEADIVGDWTIVTADGQQVEETIIFRVRGRVRDLSLQDTACL